MILVNQDIKLENTSNIINEKAPSISGIVTGECRGRLWVDRTDHPRIAIVESYATGSFAFLGVYQSMDDFISLKNFLEKELFIQLKNSGYDSFEFSIDNDSLREGILELFKHKSLQSEQECSFRAYAIPDKNPVIPRDYQIRKVEDNFWKQLSEGQYKNGEFIKLRLLENWPSFKAFMNRSIAYCAVCDRRIVAVIIGTASYSRTIAIDIETEEKHRGKGLGYAMASAFIADCLDHDYIPQWDCMESNQSSYQLAGKLGFEKMNENTVYWFDI